MHVFFKPGIDDLESDNSLEYPDEEIDLNMQHETESDMDIRTITDTESDCDCDCVPSEDWDDDSMNTDSDDEEEEAENPIPGTSKNDANTTCSADIVNKHDNNDENDEEDDTIRTILKSIHKPRSNPPIIKTDEYITDISFHSQVDVLAVATITGDLIMYKCSNEGNELISTIELHKDSIRDVEFCSDGCNIFTVSKDKSIIITDTPTEKIKLFYDKAHNATINKIYNIDELLFCTGDDSGTIKMWDIRSKIPIFSLKPVEESITSMLTNDAKKLLLMTSSDGYLTTINLSARKLYVQSEPYDEDFTCMGIYRNDSKLIVGTSAGRLYSYNWGSFGYHSDMYPWLKNSIEFMIPITDRIGCFGGDDGRIRACHIVPFHDLGIVGQHKLPIDSMDINYSGELIASYANDNEICFWNIKYFEDLPDIKYNDKPNKYKENRHNLPSSRFDNMSDFFC